ncbi:MAG: hypothetical protein Q3996_02615 [Candidatus Saccharibacteria bacterium]|nr:hypothetical protein [Candidatus Saccharibacteria bacterium]
MKTTLFTKILIGASLALIAMSGLSVPVSAINRGVQGGANAARGVDQPEQLFGNGGIFQQITNILLFLIGVLSVIMLIIGGLRYVISGGNKDAVNSAKNTILYAIVGLIVALLAYAAVDFVINVFTGGSFGNSGTKV